MMQVDHDDHFNFMNEVNPELLRSLAKFNYEQVGMIENHIEMLELE